MGDVAGTAPKARCPLCGDAVRSTGAEALSAHFEVCPRTAGPNRVRPGPRAG